LKAENVQQNPGGLMMSKSVLRTSLACAVAAMTLVLIANASAAQTRRKPAKRPPVCGNPNVTCGGDIKFQPNELPIRLPHNAVIFDSDLFYAVILQSAPSPPESCDNFIPEPERLAAQTLFPQNKVFTTRCAEPGQVSYSNTSSKAQFMAVYAGATLADANKMLAKVKATGKFPGANIRRMRAMLNGT
jgi:hypothetical protein